MSYKPQRTFNGQVGEASIDSQGPQYISNDIDEINKMFDPTSKHSNGADGGISKDNLAFTVTNDYDDTEKEHVSTSYEHANITDANPHITKATHVPITTQEGLTGTNVQEAINDLNSREINHGQAFAGAIDKVTFDDTTGKFSFYKVGEHTTPVYIIDTALEKVVTNFTYNRTKRCLVLTTPEGEVEVPLSDLVTEYDFIESDNISFTVSNHQVSALIKPSYMTEMTNLKNASESAMTNAETFEDLSSRYARGKKKDGTDVTSGTAGYNDNSFYYKELAKGYAGSADESMKASALSAKASSDSADDADKFAKRAETASLHPPYIGENGNWYVWSNTSNSFVDSGKESRGYTPVKGTDYFTQNDKNELVDDISKNSNLVEVSNSPTIGKLWVGNQVESSETQIYEKSEVDNLLNDKVDKSNTSIADNLTGGVDVQIQGTTKTVASQADFTAQKQKIESYGLSVVDGKLCLTYTE